MQSPHEPAEVLNIQDYAIIGDCRAAALIGRNGSMDWLCWPRFDSQAVFCAIVDPQAGGYWRISPTAPCASSRRYVPGTNVLETRFTNEGGAAVLTDLMPVASEEYKRRNTVPDHEILRQFECVEGEIELEMRFYPRPDFALAPAKLRPAGKFGLRLEADRAAYWLRSTLPLEVNDDGQSACLCVKLNRGEYAQFSLSYAEESPAVLSCLGPPARERIGVAIEWWRSWAERATYEGPYREAIVRSALALKLLAYAPSGAIVAAPTTSLPERIGGYRNWDYRYCWLRDASFTIRALTGLGYWEEAEAFLAWMLHATRLTQPELRILYTVFGHDAPAERELSHLRGYRDSRPVRTGNGARDQLQLDVYGEVVDAAAQFAYHGLRFDRLTQKVLIEIGKYVMHNWNRPDEGMWEPRAAPQNHTHSRVLSWTALDRLARLARQGVLAGVRAEPFERECERIALDIRQNGWNNRLQSYVQAYGGDELDASLLLISWYGFEAADSERMLGTWRAIDRHLRAGPGLLYRYRTDPAEGAFGICSFWEVEHLALGGGSAADARRLFETMLSYANDLGLYAEEIDPASGSALGNFQQGFTHVGLINAALSIHDRERGKPQLAHRPPAAEASPSGGAAR